VEWGITLYKLLETNKERKTQIAYYMIYRLVFINVSIIPILNSYFGVFAGMVGSIDINAPSESIRSIAVCLKRHEHNKVQSLLGQ